MDLDPNYTCYLTINKAPIHVDYSTVTTMYVGECTCGDWSCPAVPDPEIVANAWGDHIKPTNQPRIQFTR